jgi:hypothetical protein
MVMPERTTVSQHVQVGKETTEGTAVAAGKQLQSIGIALTPQLEQQRFRPTGTKVDTLDVPGKDWTKGDIAGLATYDELAYLFSSILQDVTPSTSGTTGKLWAYAPSAVTEDTVASYTVEQGSAARAQKAAGMIVTDLGLKWGRDQVEVSGSAMGQLFTDGITLTATPTSIPLVPVLGSQISVYADTTGAGLGTTKLLRVLSGELSIGGRFGPLWVLNSANASYAAHVELAPDITFKMLLEADAAGMGYLVNARAGSSTFIRVEAVGPVIGAGPATDKLTVDMACKVDSVDSLGDSDGVYAVAYTFRLVYDATWAAFLKVNLINSLASL